MYQSKATNTVGWMDDLKRERERGKEKMKVGGSWEDVSVSGFGGAKSQEETGRENSFFLKEKN